MPASFEYSNRCASRAYVAQTSLRGLGLACVVVALLAMGCGDQRLNRKFSEDHVFDSGGSNAADAGDVTDDGSDGLSNEEWFDAQDEVLAPWVHEIDEETAQAATVEEDTLSWSLDDYPEMAEWQVQDIVWAPYADPSYSFIRRILEIDQTDSRITFYTRKAGLDEVFAKTRDPDADGG